MGVRRRGREIALQALYLAEITKMDAEKALRSINYQQQVDPQIMKFAEGLANGTMEHVAELDSLIKKIARNWEIDRMAALDRNILRLGAYEIIYELETPVSVIIDEAVEIAKTFSTNDSGKFVNGILDKIKEERGSADAGTNAKKQSKSKN